MSIPTLNIPIQDSNNAACIVQGDTIAKITVSSSDFPDLTTSTIKMQVYKGSLKVLDVSNGSGITIVSATEFEIDEISAVNNNLPDGANTGDLEITDTNGVRTTYFRVQYNITKQYTV